MNDLVTTDLTGFWLNYESEASLDLYLLVLVTKHFIVFSPPVCLMLSWCRILLVDGTRWLLWQHKCHVIVSCSTLYQYYIFHHSFLFWKAIFSPFLIQMKASITAFRKKKICWWWFWCVMCVHTARSRQGEEKGILTNATITHNRRTWFCGTLNRHPLNLNAPYK